MPPPLSSPPWAIQRRARRREDATYSSSLPRPIRFHGHGVTAAPASRVKAAVVTLTPLSSGVRVTCDVGYLYANFSLVPRPLFSSYARCTRQTYS